MPGMARPSGLFVVKQHISHDFGMFALFKKVLTGETLAGRVFCGTVLPLFWGGKIDENHYFFCNTHKIKVLCSDDENIGRFSCFRMVKIFSEEKGFKCNF